MDFDFTWLLWGLPLAFAAGWGASRLDLRQWRMESRQAPKAYFRGLNHLLNEQQDQAIDAFIEAVQGDPDTAELHFALGNLFRRRGDYDRAVRVHEHLLSRADITNKDRDRAQHALALDFLKAGLLDRAEAALNKLQGSAFEGEALLALLGIYERSRDWPRAKQIAQRLEAADQGSFSTRLAHYLCEEADIAQRSNDRAQALRLLEEAIQCAPQLARGWMALSTLKVQAGDVAGAMEALLRLNQHAPQGLPLAAQALADLARQTGRQAEALEVLQASHERAPSIDITQALASLSLDPEAVRNRYLSHLEREPSLVITAQWLAGETLSSERAQARVQQALEQASAPLRRYRCAACGFEARQHFWQCPGCQTWDSYPARRVEEL
ncbi:lipopolysaccharide assembly protein LapB [Hydrogenophaga sp. PBL-H3]|uniref:lipopolysaccharide assembly protein LapB n=1 Tax=Hydrogenophaga sp. PBL-H3 TaxID=434010 RepID=UPI00131F5549|nr:lipopolysaccharide assembly protein LapB [Hydrogenophaga sp. PBL-H3]QHE77098.1 lipopolysaccharide assembly protein LapB [Hydrogenophaga sp. PBL-H3]QHE81522.1 lipopolysaccharide assembly protein LapB [Hydrogenophaga sp. PBL-H3]